MRLLAKIGIAILTTALVLVALAPRLPDMRANVSKRDSIAYWAAARFLLYRQNPYDTAQVLRLERGEGYTDAKPLVLRTPPWSLWIVLPLGLLSAFWAWVAWVVVSLAALLVSLRLCWKIYGGAGIAPTVFWLVGYLFAPVPACLVAGQIGLILLLGLALFLWLEGTHPFLAGVALILPFAKPHLLSVAGLVLIAWALEKRRWAIISGFLVALTTAVVIALIFDHSIFQHYRELLREAAIGSEFIPALSGVLRLLFFRRLFWVQFIPAGCAAIWGVWFYTRHRLHWQWRHHGMALIVVSVLTTPYAWFTDEVVLLPAILHVSLLTHAARNHFAWKTKITVAFFASLNLLLLLILRSKVSFSTGIYFWSSLVWFGWYFYAQKFPVEACGASSEPGN